MARNTESSVSDNVNAGNFNASHLSNFIPPNTPPTIIAAI